MKRVLLVLAVAVLAAAGVISYLSTRNMAGRPEGSQEGAAASGSRSLGTPRKESGQGAMPARGGSETPPSQNPPLYPDVIETEIVDRVMPSQKDDAREIARVGILASLPPARDGAVPFIAPTFRRYDYLEPCVSPDGTKVVFSVANLDEVRMIYLCDLKSGSLRNLTESFGQNPVCGPKFSPDGRWVVFCGFPRSGLWLIDLMDPGAPPISLVNDPTAMSPGWSADGKRLVYYCEPPRRIRILDVKAKTVTYTIVSDPGTIFCEPSFSPDGEEIAFVHQWRIEGKVRRSLGIWSLKSSRKKVLTFPKDVHMPVFSPNGKYIAFRGNVFGKTYGEIFLYSIAKNSVQRLSQGGGAHPTWLPDSTGVVFISPRGTGIARLYTLRLPNGD